MSRFYITTPIYYVSDVPHLGHAYTTVVADTLARFSRLRGQPTRFLTGTDDHGQKIARLAETAGTTARAYADKYADAYRTTWQKLGISNDDFIRTTDPDHEAVVQDLWRAMMKNGALYVGDYEGWYCVACEQFYTEKDLENTRTQSGFDCPMHKRAVEKVKEKSYYFRLSQYAQPLLDHYEKHPEFIQPEIRRNEVTQFVKSGLQDLSVSRTTFAWGIPVPDEPGHVIYVWLDALTNYYSATRRSADAKQFWDDPDSRIVHLIGKEISRFHAVYWPAFLMAAGWPLPKTVFAHGWWTVNGEKMSKTLGNVVDPVSLSEDIGVDAFRYFVLREVPLGADGDFAHEALITRYNAELANDLGNLLNRTLGMVQKYGVTPVAGLGPFPLAQHLDAATLHMDQLQPSRALEEIWALVRAGNGYIDAKAPWKPEANRVEILGNVLELCRALAHVLSPFIPTKAREMLRQLGLDEPAEFPNWKTGNSFTVQAGTPLFPRIDEERKAALLAKWRPQREAPAAATAADGKSHITFEEFQKLDLRVGKVVAAQPVPKAKKLLQLTVDIGSEKRQVVAGIAEKYTAEAVIGKNVIFLANLKPATIRGVLSEGMILAAQNDRAEEAVVALVGLDADVPPGTKVR
jgi:methionyl-tRNA synthetase